MKRAILKMELPGSCLECPMRANYSNNYCPVCTALNGAPILSRTYLTVRPDICPLEIIEEE
jgi:hypothetical protein